MPEVVPAIGATPVHIVRIEAVACRVPTLKPVVTSFGIMRDRPAVFVRVEDRDGAFGWGEVFANWPAAGAEHRVRLLELDIAPLVLGRDWSAPGALLPTLTRETHIRALQCGEWGPFRQVLAALDVAHHDLWARRCGVPLRQLLNPNAADMVAAYASGIHIDAAPDEIDRARTAGFSAFKVKVGFGKTDETARLRRLVDGLESGERLFADANQAWNTADAERFLRKMAGSGLGWIEEPIPADSPEADWARLAVLKAVPLAGGENIAGEDGFARALALGALDYVQPDVAKWGGVSGCLAVARAALAAGRIYCPHFLGGGIGLAASAHVLAAAGGSGLLEVDVNPNPLRDAFGAIQARMKYGMWGLGDAPGLGIGALPDAVSRSVTLRREIT